MAEVLTVARFFFSFLNLALLTALFYLCCGQYRKIRSQFTLGLLLVLLALLFHTLVMNPAFHLAVGTTHLLGAFGLLALASDIFETVALAVLLYLTWK